MKLIHIYQCFCDETRLRILNLLAANPLCVCHFQDVLGAPQVKISKHLAYLREHGLVESRREGNWMIYSLAHRPPPELSANLKCLQDCVQTHAVFAHDLQRMRKLLAKCAGPPAVCAARPANSRTKAAPRSLRTRAATL